MKNTYAFEKFSINEYNFLMKKFGKNNKLNIDGVKIITTINLLHNVVHLLFINKKNKIKINDVIDKVRYYLFEQNKKGQNML